MYRVNQLDAVALDEELNVLFSQQCSSVVKYIDSDFVTRWKAEIDAVLQLLLWRYTILRDRPSPGNELNNLKYHNDNFHHAATQASARLFAIQKWMRAFLCIGVRYSWLKMEHYMLMHGWHAADDWRQTTHLYLHRLNAMYKCFSILNFLTFLVNGRFVTLLDRLLRMRLVYIRPNLARQVNFDIMNEQLFYHGFSEFTLFMMTLINFNKVRSYMRRFYSYIHRNVYTRFIRGHSGSTNVDSIQNADGDDDEFLSNLDDPCPICQSPSIVTPFITQCGHIYCYYCIAATRLDQPTYICAICSSVVTHTKRYVKTPRQPLSIQ